MAAKGFIELLRLADRGKKRQVSQIDQTLRWSGVAFEILGRQFVAPLGDIAEVIYVPEWTPVPSTQKWACGVANIRGRLLSVSHLAAFLNHSVNEVKTDSKVLCLMHPKHYCGVIVDQVFGIQHFNQQSYFKQANDLPPELQEFCQGYFMYQSKPWHVFMFRDLLNNPRFLSPSH
ncbi:chemotaxis protein CheW [Acinetobacter qingfengensis]|uniref:Twitching motility protein PilT n=1 Tax=Acinetobacter qingfengensis TaxID=1262585 RepID=A0A1E7RDD6_9GAMM|nr:chemotaxis protein CheW [Acinetobacter qingfengensis]KAA8734439.1 chemotaxis protein CheW [Acinetobacter qingfengensis]OEY97351.1 twitching motility protein PilT [Acinetobacter qingfengensis]